MTEQRFPEQRFLKDVDYDDTAIGEVLFEACREPVYHSQREGLSVGQSSSSVSERTGRSDGERTGRPVRPSGQELNVANAQIRIFLDRQREQILADCQPEIRRHEFQANYHRRSVQKIEWNDRIAARRTSSRSSRRTSSTRSTTSSWTVIEAKLGFTWSTW